MVIYTCQVYCFTFLATEDTDAVLSEVEGEHKDFINSIKYFVGYYTVSHFYDRASHCN